MARASASLVASDVAAAAVYFAFVLLVARLAGPVDRGIVAFVTTLALLLGYGSTLGLEAANLYFAGSRPESRRGLATTSIVVGIGSGSLLALGAWALFAWQDQWIPAGTSDAILVATLASTGLITAQVSLDAALIGSGAVGPANAVRIAIPVTSVVIYLGTYAVTGDAGAGVAVGAWIAGRTLGIALAVGSTAVRIGLVAPRRALVTAREALRYGLPAHVGMLASLPIRRFDTLILGATRGAFELGIYTAAVNGAEMLMYLPTAVATVLVPTAAGWPAQEVRRIVRRAMLVVVLLTSIAAIAAAALAPWLIRFVFGPEFSGATTPLRILMVALVGTSVRILANAGLLACRRQGLASTMAVITLFVIVALDLALIPPFGAEGAAWASAVAYWVGGIGAFAAFRRIAPNVEPARLGDDLRAAWGLMRRLRRIGTTK